MRFLKRNCLIGLLQIFLIFIIVTAIDPIISANLTLTDLELLNRTRTLLNQTTKELEQIKINHKLELERIEEEHFLDKATSIVICGIYAKYGYKKTKQEYDEVKSIIKNIICGVSILYPTGTINSLGNNKIDIIIDYIGAARHESNFKINTIAYNYERDRTGKFYLIYSNDKPTGEKVKIESRSREKGYGDLKALSVDYGYLQNNSVCIEGAYKRLKQLGVWNDKSGEWSLNPKTNVLLRLNIDSYDIKCGYYKNHKVITKDLELVAMLKRLEGWGRYK